MNPEDFKQFFNDYDKAHAEFVNLSPGDHRNLEKRARETQAARKAMSDPAMPTCPKCKSNHQVIMTFTRPRPMMGTHFCKFCNQSFRVEGPDPVFAHAFPPEFFNQEPAPTPIALEIANSLIHELRAEIKALKLENEKWDVAHTGIANATEFIAQKANKLKAENAELKKDKARLDWLDKKEYRTNYWDFFGRWEVANDEGRIIGLGADIREAIDAAQEGAK